MNPVKGYPLAFHVALDGNGINGLEGLAGVCLFLFDPETERYAYKVMFYDGIAAGHAVAVNPSGTIGFLGNAGQHLLFYDATTLEEIARISTLRFEPTSCSLQGSTHLVWLSDREFITAVGDHFYHFSLDDLQSPKQLARHGVKLPHAMKLTRSGRYLVYGSMDNPADAADGEARHVGVMNVQTGEIRVLPLPATCWHLVTHEREEIAYAVSFRVAPQDYVDYQEWGMSFLKEYLFEIDVAAGHVLRHWSAGREVPAHINSDITLSDREVIFCNGGSQSVVLVDRESFGRFRIIDERPDLAEHLARPREVGTQIYDVLARGGVFTSSRHILGALRVSRFALLDSIYACQLDARQRLLFTANRGLNHITIYDYPSAELRLRVRMPELQEYVPWIGKNADPRLGFHHSVLLG